MLQKSLLLSALVLLPLALAACAAPTPAATATSAPTLTSSPSPTVTATATPSPSPAPTATATWTPLPPTATPTDTPTPTPDLFANQPDPFIESLINDPEKLYQVLMDTGITESSARSEASYDGDAVGLNRSTPYMHPEDLIVSRVMLATHELRTEELDGITVDYVKVLFLDFDVNTGDMFVRQAWVSIGVMLSPEMADWFGLGGHALDYYPAYYNLNGPDFEFTHPFPDYTREEYLTEMYKQHYVVFEWVYVASTVNQRWYNIDANAFTSATHDDAYWEDDRSYTKKFLDEHDEHSWEALNLQFAEGGFIAKRYLFDKYGKDDTNCFLYYYMRCDADYVPTVYAEPEYLDVLDVEQ